jgi:aminoglycoside/choline kinase family phosphotransferase
VLLAAGRTADVFALDEGRVLRRYRDGTDVTAEVEVMAYLSGLGFPVPRVDEADGTDLVMERLYGPTMLHAMLGGELDVDSAVGLLVDLQARLHALPARRSTRPDERILHLDLHPDNVVLSSRGPVVIDWQNAAEGPPDLDLALSALILAQVALDEESGMAAMAGEGLRGFLARTGGDPVRLLDRAIAMRTRNPTMSREEIERLPSAAAMIIGYR